MQRSHVVASIIFGAAFLLTGYWIGSTKCLKPLRLNRASQHWRNAICTVISSKEHYTPPDEDVGAKFGIDVTYEFSVNNQTYRSERYNFQQNELKDGEEMSRLVDKFAPGAKCLAFYNPLDPQQAVIERRANIKTINWVMALVFGIMGGAALLSGIQTLIKR